jgi:hypothetical protein
VRSSLLFDGVFPASVSIAQGSTIAPQVRSSFQEALFTIDAEDARVTHIVLLHSVGRYRDAVKLEAKRNSIELDKDLIKSLVDLRATKYKFSDRAILLWSCALGSNRFEISSGNAGYAPRP